VYKRQRGLGDVYKRQPLYPKPETQSVMESKVLKGALSSKNWAKNIAGPLIVFMCLL
jgi:hypothetical protein